MFVRRKLFAVLVCVFFFFIPPFLFDTSSDTGSVFFNCSAYADRKHDAHEEKIPGSPELMWSSKLPVQLWSDESLYIGGDGELLTLDKKRTLRLYSNFYDTVTPPLWSTEVAMHGKEGARVYIHDDKVLFVSDKSMWAFDKGNGKSLWHWDSQFGINKNVLFEGETLIFLTLKNALYCFNIESGEQLWSKLYNSSDVMLNSNSGFAYSSGFFIPPLSNGGVKAVDFYGNELWSSVDLGNNMYLNGMNVTPVITEELVIISNYNGKIFAHNRSSGEQVWSRDVNVYAMREVEGSLLILTDGKLLLLSFDTGVTEREIVLKGIVRNAKRGYRAQSELYVNGNIVWVINDRGEFCLMDLESLGQEPMYYKLFKKETRINSMSKGRVYFNDRESLFVISES